MKKFNSDFYKNNDHLVITESVLHRALKFAGSGQVPFIACYGLSDETDTFELRYGRALLRPLNPLNLGKAKRLEFSPNGRLLPKLIYDSTPRLHHH